MASRTIGTVLSLRDNMSSGLVRVNRNVQNMSRETRRASQQVANFANSAKKNFEAIGDKTIKLGATIAGAVGALATKTGLSEAMDLEGYRVQLETATKDTKKAGQLMSDAVKFANKTPFETGAVVEATAKMEMYGLSSKRWLADVADMAGSTNKSIDQATEAMADVAVGEFERIKEFGLKKDMILAASNKKYGEGVVFNGKGQVINQAKLMDVVQSMMQDKFKGGAEKLANTTKGLWSTITGVTKNSLAKIVGMQEDGTIKQGSLLDTVKGKIKKVADQLQKWQTDGTIEKIADTAKKAFDKLFEIIGKVFNFLIEHKKTIETIVIVFASFYTAIKIMKILQTVIFGVQIAMALFNGTLALSPIGWITLALAALIAIGVLLWKNWDVVKAKAFELWEGFKQAFAPLAEFFSNLWGGITSGFKGFVNFLIGGLNGIIGGINNLASFKLPDWIPRLGGKGFELNIPKIPKFALGTSYFTGGLAQINERGGEIVNLPNGSQVIPADKSKNMLSKSNVTVHITVQGNVIGNEEYADYVGDVVVKKVKLVLDTM